MAPITDKGLISLKHSKLQKSVMRLELERKMGERTGCSQTTLKDVHTHTHTHTDAKVEMQRRLQALASVGWPELGVWKQQCA